MMAEEHEATLVEAMVAARRAAAEPELPALVSAGLLAAAASVDAHLSSRPLRAVEPTTTMDAPPEEAS